MVVHIKTILLLEKPKMVGSYKNNTIAGENQDGETNGKQVQ